MYRIKELKHKGFSYMEIGKVIRGKASYKQNVKSLNKSDLHKRDVCTSNTSHTSSRKISWFKYLINIIKKFYVKHFQKEKSKT